MAEKFRKFLVTYAVICINAQLLYELPLKHNKSLMLFYIKKIKNLQKEPRNNNSFTLDAC